MKILDILLSILSFFFTQDLKVGNDSEKIYTPGLPTPSEVNQCTLACPIYKGTSLKLKTDRIKHLFKGIKMTIS